jgi:uncharacterized NAD-dependent epimerase/dehydratase family protein
VKRSAAILTLGHFQTPNAKTAHGLVRGPSRYEIVGVVDERGAGSDAGLLLDGRPRGIPVHATLASLLERARPDFCIVGVATHGGVLPPEFRAVIRDALARGIGVVNGLHEILSKDPELSEIARRSGAEIIDIRAPKPRAELHFWNGAVLSVRAPRVAVLGTDCALGKRTTCQLLAAACAKEGLRAGIVSTGQTGWLQGIDHGFVLDATPNDFVSGELEHAIVSLDRDRSPDLILLEGQSALRNPSGPCGAELILSGRAAAVVLQHAPARRHFDDLEELGLPIPPLREEVELVRLYGSRVIAIALNHAGLSDEALIEARASIARETGLPVVAPLLEGCGTLVPLLRELVRA